MISDEESQTDRYYYVIRYKTDVIKLNRSLKYYINKGRSETNLKLNE